MSTQDFGNRITDNAFGADNGKKLIEAALTDIERDLGWKREGDKPLFSGVYYDSQKVGSFIVKVSNQEGKTAVLKLQLKPLPYDEGFIIRHVEAHYQGTRIRPPKLYADQPWEAVRGYGYLVFEDLSDLPNLWTYDVTDEEDRKRHKDFLKTFFSTVLPVEPWIPNPNADLKAKSKELFQHFHEIALKSSHHHVEESEVMRMAERYFVCVDQAEPETFHFTHGHLSGKDVKYDQAHDSYVVLANLYWSWRPEYYELVFPMWVDLMHIRDENLTFQSFLERMESWCAVWREGLVDHDPTNRKAFWLRLLERAMMTFMLDLGASEWKEEEKAQKQALLECWKEFFYWIVEEKLSPG